MPAGPIGASWAAGSWTDTSWEIGTWAGLGSVPTRIGVSGVSSRAGSASSVTARAAGLSSVSSRTPRVSDVEGA